MPCSQDNRGREVIVSMGPVESPVGKEGTIGHNRKGVIRWITEVVFLVKQPYQLEL